MKYLFYMVSLLLVLSACSSHKSDSPAPQGGEPAAALLTFPAQNSICVSGSAMSATQSSILFQWNKSDNTDSYELNIKNLLSGATQTQTTAGAQATVTLLRNTPYSWWVISKSAKTSQTAVSDTWKFYNAGDGVTSYAPFPADQLLPGMGDYVDATAGMITLTWTGSDPDNDIIGYDVYFGTSTTPALYKQGITATSFANVPVTTGKQYYWKVVAHDSQGNASESDIIKFNVN
jgi:hypothetical protein